MSFPPMPHWEWAMLGQLQEYRNSANETALVGMARDPAPADLKAVRTGIGTALRALYSEVLREEIPERISELLTQIEQQLRQLDQRDRDST